MDISGIKSQVIDNHSSRFIQLEALQQNNPRTCGYYAIFNALIVSVHVISKTFLLSNLYDRSIFESCEKKIKSFLCKRTQQHKESGEFNLWDMEVIEKGSLERTHLKEILREFDFNSIDEISNYLKKDVNLQDYITDLPDFNLTSLENNQLPIKKIFEINEIISKFQSSSSYFHSFILGLTNHWLCISIIKSKDFYEIVIVDSENHWILNSDEEGFTRLAESARENRVKKYGLENTFMVSDYIFKLDIDRFRSTKEFISIFQSVLSGNQNFVEKIFSIHIEGLIKSFESRRLIKTKNISDCVESRHLNFLALYDWQQNLFPLPVFREHMRNCFGFSFYGRDSFKLIGESNLDNLMRWVAEMVTILETHLNPHKKPNTRKRRVTEDSLKSTLDDCQCCCCTSKSNLESIKNEENIYCEEVGQLLSRERRKYVMFREFLSSIHEFLLGKRVKF